tara:strand:+ start:168 stop:968 length:801 start_codon:yes stop_codon:yes gene_type:complete
MSLHEKIRTDIIKHLSQENSDKINQLNNSMRLLAKWRSVLIQNTLLQNEGKIVRSGPFCGMDFLERSSEGCHIAKLLGSYEQPLFPYIEEAITSEFDAILNIGCAEGYYAVGMAMRMPNTRVLAFDTNSQAQASCKELAIRNKVSERVEIGGTFSASDFERYDQEHTLLLCDIEGAENELLDLRLAHCLKDIYIIVESHDCIRPGTTQRLLERFSATHHITQVNDNGAREVAEAPQWFNNLGHLDQLLATWEWRSGPTPWLIMKPK